MPHSTQIEKERITLTPGNQAGVRVVRRHHLLVRCSHWLNVPIRRAKQQTIGQSADIPAMTEFEFVVWRSPDSEEHPDRFNAGLLLPPRFDGRKYIIRFMRLGSQEAGS